jgi:hypothetical protein
LIGDGTDVKMTGAAMLNIDKNGMEMIDKVI